MHHYTAIMDNVKADRKADRLRSPFIVNDPFSKKADKVGLNDGELICNYADDAVALIDIRKDLQKEVDALIGEESAPKIGITRFKNWGKTNEALLLLVKPTTKEQVVAVVKGVRNLNEKKEVKVEIGMGGSYHTWSSTYPDSRGLLINTCDLKLDKQNTTDGHSRIHLNVPENEEEAKTVTISPGVTTGELMSFFLDNDVCFESDVILPTVTYGGVLSGGCHGVGEDQQSMSDEIVSLKLVDGNGDVRTLPHDTKHKGELSVTPEEILKSAQVTLGVYGVVIEFTVKVKPMSNCTVHNIFNKKLEDVVPRETFLEDIGLPTHTKKLAKLLGKYWSVELFWFPFNSIIERLLRLLPSDKDTELNMSTSSFFADHPKDTIHHLKQVIETGNLLPLLWCPWEDYLWIRGIDIDRKREKEITQEPGIPFWSRVIDVAQHSAGKYILSPLMQNLPGSTPISLMIGFELVKLQYGTFQTEEVVRTPWAVHYRDGIDIMTVYDLEFAFPIDIKHPVKAVKAIREVIDITEKYAFGNAFPKEGDSSDSDSSSSSDSDSSDSEESAKEKTKKKKEEKIRFPLTLVMEMRVMRKSDALLCPATLGEEEHIAYIEVLSTTGTQGYEQYFTDIAKAWIKLDGIPHWQKQWDFLQKDFDIFEYLRKKYGKNMETFMKVHKELDLDPKGIFMNDLMKKLLLDQ